MSDWILHYSWELFGLRTDYFEITPSSRGESALRFPIEKDAKEFVGGSHHVKFVRFSFGTFPVHKLKYRFIIWSVMKDGTHHKEQSYAQGSGAAFGNTAAVDIHLFGLARRGVNACQSYKGSFGMEAAYITNLRHELGIQDMTDAKHLYYNRIFWQVSCRSLRELLNQAKERSTTQCLEVYSTLVLYVPKCPHQGPTVQKHLAQTIYDNLRQHKSA